MFGASIYLSEDLDFILNYLDLMSKYGVKSIFTSLHMAEEDTDYIKSKLKAITDRLTTNNQELMVDISTKTLELYDLEFSELSGFLKNYGVTSLRIDYGFSFEEINELSKDFKIVLNASTIDDAYTNNLTKAGLVLSDVTVCHNFYPRLDTGLSRKTFFEKNKFLKEKGFRIQAFIAGDDRKRGPFHEGLPTIEDHRFINPFLAYVELNEDFGVDDIFIGDISLKEETLERINAFNEEKVINLRLDKITEIPRQADVVFWDIHKNRKDYSSRVVRSTITRIKIKEGIKAVNTNTRHKGTITIDNENYGRYNGELQVTMVDLPADKRVNVIGNIKDEDINLLKYIKDDVRFKFIKE